jgi:hypothetical protein
LNDRPARHDDVSAVAAESHAPRFGAGLSGKSLVNVHQRYVVGAEPEVRYRQPPAVAEHAEAVSTISAATKPEIGRVIFILLMACSFSLRRQPKAAGSLHLPAS